MLFLRRFFLHTVLMIQFFRTMVLRFPISFYTLFGKKSRFEDSETFWFPQRKEFSFYSIQHKIWPKTVQNLVKMGKIRIFMCETAFSILEFTNRSSVHPLDGQSVRVTFLGYLLLPTHLQLIGLSLFFDPVRCRKNKAGYTAHKQSFAGGQTDRRANKAGWVA